jgi:hypothetical protein
MLILLFSILSFCSSKMRNFKHVIETALPRNTELVPINLLHGNRKDIQLFCLNAYESNHSGILA